VTAIDVATALLADDESKKSGPIGLVVILVLCIACYFLFKSMSKHLRKVREEFPTDSGPNPSDRPAPPAEPPAVERIERIERIDQNGDAPTETPHGT
jgi:hypothetical protein